MRPFKFFFALSLGMILFLFFAKIVVTALIVAAFMSIVFAVFRKAKRFFQRLSWEDESYNYRYEMPRESGLPFWKEDLFTDTPYTKDRIYLANHRRIIVR